MTRNWGLGCLDFHQTVGFRVEKEAKSRGTRGVFTTQSNLYDEALWRKQLTTDGKQDSTNSSPLVI